MRLFMPVAFIVAASLLVACGGPEGDTQAQSLAEPDHATVSEAAPVTWTEDTPIGTIVAERPETARLFELVGIDYCCGGETPLGEAASASSIDAARLLGALSVVGPQTAGTSRDWQSAPLTELMDHIVATHHTWLRRELPRIQGLVETVTDVHGDAHPELTQVRTLFLALNTAIGPHLEDEEQRVFPALERLVEGERPEGVEALLAAMHGDHDEVGAALHQIRDLTSGFRVPDDACRLYREMLAGLEALEHDLHQHVHLENNVLLPRALARLESN